MPWSLACDQYGRCITLPESFPLKTFHLYNRSSGKVSVPSPSRLLPGDQAAPSQPRALGSCWGLAGSGAVCHWVRTVPAPCARPGQHEGVSHTLGWQVRDSQAGVPGAPGAAWSPWGCWLPVPAWLDPLPAPMPSAPASAHHCIPDQGTARPRHPTRRVPPLPLMPLPQNFVPLQPPLSTGLFSPPPSLSHNLESELHYS